MHLKMTAFFREMDLFGVPVELNLKRSMYHKTLFGAFFSLIILAVTGWYWVE
jgi:hypothetical protein